MSVSVCGRGAIADTRLGIECVSVCGRGAIADTR